MIDIDEDTLTELFVLVSIVVVIVLLLWGTWRKRAIGDR